MYYTNKLIDVNKKSENILDYFDPVLDAEVKSEYESAIQLNPKHFNSFENLEKYAQAINETENAEITNHSIKSLRIKSQELADEAKQAIDNKEFYLFLTAKKYFGVDFPEEQVKSIKSFQLKILNTDCPVLRNEYIEKQIKKINILKNKATDSKYWHRKFKILKLQKSEEINIRAGIVSDKVNKRCSNQIRALYEQKLKDNQEYAEKTFLTDGNNTFSMTQCMQKPENRFNEFLVLTDAIEKYAEELGLSWSFITLTAPPKMHPNPSVGKNKWDKKTLPIMAHRKIAENWHRAQAMLYKKEITHIGTRTVETHKDATPHWHMVVFHAEEDFEEIVRAVRTHFPGKTPLFRKGKPLIDKGTGKQKINYQADIVAGKDIKDKKGDPKKAVSYLGKYIKKNFLINDEKTSKKKEYSEAFDNAAWRWTWRIRSVQNFGIKSVIGIIRELRKVKNETINEEGIKINDIPEIAKMAQNNDFLSIIRLFNNNETCEEATQQINIIKEQYENQYGEIINRSLGINIGGRGYITKKQWDFVEKPIHEEEEPDQLLEDWKRMKDQGNKSETVRQIIEKERERGLNKAFEILKQNFKENKVAVIYSLSSEPPPETRKAEELNGYF